MITAKEARENIGELKKTPYEIETENLYKGFLDFVDKEIIKATKNGYYGTLISSYEFKEKLKWREVPDYIIDSLKNRGFKVGRLGLWCGISVRWQ